MGDDNKMYGIRLENLLMTFFSQDRTSLLPETLLNWDVRPEMGESHTSIAHTFLNILKPYQLFIHDIVGVLFKHFSQVIGEAESNEHDDDGIHKEFHDGKLGETGDKRHMICKRRPRQCSDRRSIIKKQVEERIIKDQDEIMKKMLEKKYLDFENNNENAINKMKGKENLIEDNNPMLDYVPQTLHGLSKAIAEETYEWCRNLKPDFKAQKMYFHFGGGFRIKRIAVGLSERFALVGCCGRNGKTGFIFVYGYRAQAPFGYAFEYFDGFILRDNSFIVKHPKITIQIEDGGYLGDFNFEDLSKIEIGQNNLQLHLNLKINKALIKTMDEVYKNREKNAFDDFSKDQSDKVFTEAIRDKIREYIKENVDSSKDFTTVGNHMREILTNTLTKLTDDAKKLVINQYDKFRTIFTKKNDYPQWCVTNCAENHVITGFRMINEEIQYLRAYDVKRNVEGNEPKLKICLPCANCEMTNSKIPFPPTIKIIEWKRELEKRKKVNLNIQKQSNIPVPSRQSESKRRTGHSARRRFILNEPNSNRN